MAPSSNTLSFRNYMALFVSFVLHFVLNVCSVTTSVFFVNETPLLKNMKFYAILLIFGPLLVLGQYVENVQITEKSGVWQVGNCTLAQFSMNFTLKLPNYNETSNITVKVPHNAKVSSKSTCGGFFGLSCFQCH